MHQPDAHQIFFGKNQPETSMNRYLILTATILLTAVTTLARGGPNIVDEQVVFSYNHAVQAGNPEAVETVFALTTAGASAEAQDIVLGRLIPRHPRLFLEALQHSQFAHCKACLPGLLGNLGVDYVDHFAAQERELKKRRNALHGIRVKALTALRNTCITELNRQIRRAESARDAEKGGD